LDVKSILANQRQGTHKSKQRNEISGSSRKLRNKKVLVELVRVTSRTLSSKVVDGISVLYPRDYSFKLNKKVKDLARKSALTIKQKTIQLQYWRISILIPLKTKQYVALLNALSLGDKKDTPRSSEGNKNVF
jgi:large subunit ribosomal protein L4